MKTAFVLCFTVSVFCLASCYPSSNDESPSPQGEKSSSSTTLPQPNSVASAPAQKISQGTAINEVIPASDWTPPKSLANVSFSQSGGGWISESFIHSSQKLSTKIEVGPCPTSQQEIDLESLYNEKEVELISLNRGTKAKTGWYFQKTPFRVTTWHARVENATLKQCTKFSFNVVNVADDKLDQLLADPEVATLQNALIRSVSRRLLSPTGMAFTFCTDQTPSLASDDLGDRVAANDWICAFKTAAEVNDAVSCRDAERVYCENIRNQDRVPGPHNVPSKGWYAGAGVKAMERCQCP